ncbi:protein of unknown function (plasmid) [Cupriavidus taiwanensis]|uniref:Uncharacterized protein n=1 Tax=Cupriavidus taiwanensis TaxID=164546 RepID=A0A375FMC0_9BURK|nr:hypothetical protein CBM2614_U10006 [Cupriavidus taiwanensis]SPA11576.1 protein of unknown function [Cupriavidus taiwanensis]SPA57482.1 protein of unknown function [Cupriavidus taiwanensis]SPD49315.1 protein of unknown function [Cupriavidus taiwanensis]
MVVTLDRDGYSEGEYLHPTQRCFWAPIRRAAAEDRLSLASIAFQRLHQLEGLYRNAPVALCFIARAQGCVSANHRYL